MPINGILTLNSTKKPDAEAPGLKFLMIIS